MDRVKGLFKNNMRQYAMLIVLVAIIIFFEIITDGILLKPQNVTNLVLQNSYVIILATGMVLCILTGGNIDLSVGSIVAFIGAIAGKLIVSLKVGIPAAVVVCLLAGVAIGIWQGFWIAYVRIPPFIVTLAGMLLFRGLTLVLLQGLTISPFPDSFLVVSSGFIPDIFGIPGVRLNMLTLVAGMLVSAIYIIYSVRKRAGKQRYGFEVAPISLFLLQTAATAAVINLFAYCLASYKGMPVILILLAVLVLVYSFITTRTIPGRHIYALGGNEKAARLSGVDTNKVLFFVYLNMAVLSAVTGIVFTARLQAATPSAGTGFEMDAIASCFIGGASATGGIGTVTGALIGALVMGILNNGMSILGVGSDWQQAIKGFVLLMAVAFDVVSKNRSKT